MFPMISAKRINPTTQRMMEKSVSPINTVVFKFCPNELQKEIIIFFTMWMRY